MRLRSRAALLGLGLFLLLHTGSANAQKNEPPGVSPIQATFVAPNTFYSLEVLDPDGDALSIEWGYTGIGGCTAFTSINPQGTLVLWGPHDQDPPCVHDASGGHPITVIATVSDPCGNSVRRSYEGSLDGVGPATEPNFQPQLYRGAVVPLRTTPCFSPTPTPPGAVVTTEQPELAADIVVIGVETDGGYFFIGRPATVTVTAVNRGTAPGSETVTIQITQITQLTQIASLDGERPSYQTLLVDRLSVNEQVRFDDLAPGQTRVETFTWIPPDAGDWSISAGDQRTSSQVFLPGQIPPLTIDSIPDLDGASLPEIPSQVPPAPELEEEVM